MIEKNKIVVGNDIFDEFRKKDYYFVDKTRFICDFIDDNGNITLITRPRRFGKTLTMTMLRDFFSTELDREYQKKLFNGMYIEKYGSSYMDMMGSKPVIFMTFKNMKSMSFSGFKERLYKAFSNPVRDFYDISDHKRINKYDMEFLEMFLPRVYKPENYSDEFLFSSLDDFMQIMHKYYGLKPMVLIDEYDAPVNASLNSPDNQQIIAGIRDFMGNGLKTNHHLDCALITGINRIAQESIFSVFNNPNIYDVTNDKYADIFGFTEDEVRDVLKYAGFEKDLDIVRKWYNGYSIGSQRVYNPISVMKYCADRGEISAYWANTSSNDIIGKIAKNLSDDGVSSVARLIHGGTVTEHLCNNITVEDLADVKQSVFTVLLHAGYLTGRRLSSKKLDFEFCIPNEEIRSVFKREIIQKLIPDFGETLQGKLNAAIVSGIDVEENINEILKRYVSFHDNIAKECAYHALMLGIVLSLEDSYEIYSNIESGYGRLDICLAPRNTSKRGIIIELKHSEKDNMKRKAAEGYKQSISKEYQTILNKKGIKDIKLYGIAFCDKTAVVCDNEADMKNWLNSEKNPNVNNKDVAIQYIKSKGGR